MNSIEGEVREAIKELEPILLDHKEGRHRFIYSEEIRALQTLIDTAEKFLSLTTKPLDEKEVEMVITKLAIEENSVRHPTDLMLASVINKVVHTFCSHFSKPVIKYVEYEQFTDYENCEAKSPANYTRSVITDNIHYKNGYNQAIDDMRRINREQL